MKALASIRIIDLTHMLSGPYATMLLADLGAEVIKVEPLEGEGTRRLLANDPEHSLHGMGAYFLTLGRNKKSVTLNLKSEEGLAVFYDLVRGADVVAYNFSAGVPERLGIGHARLSEINPRIITASITGFGETGPSRDHTSFDVVAQATGGGMSVTGTGEVPMRAGIPIGDLGGGLMGALGILAALQARVTTGRGQHVDVSMQDTQVSLLNYMATMTFLSGHQPPAAGNAHFVHVPYNTYPTADGFMIIAVIADNIWPRLIEVLGAKDLDTAENRGQPGRWKNKDHIEARMSEIFREHPRSHWLPRLREMRVPCAPVNSIEDALRDPHLMARNMIVDVAHPEGGSVKQAGNPIKLSEGGSETFSPPPLVGQHNAEVLSGLLGYPADKIAALRASGVVL